MKFYIKNSNILTAMALLLLATTGCKKDYDNPNAAPEDQVLTSARGMTSVAIGLQRTYSFSRAGSVYNMVTANGFVTNELILLNAGNVPEFQLNSGGAVIDGTNTILANIWANASKVILDANRVIAASQTLADKPYVSGLVGYSTIYKAMALGSLSMYWEKVPDTVGVNVTFSDRIQGFTKAIASIDRALAMIAATPISASFATNVPAGTDIVNTLQALKARYALFAGNYSVALAAANAVDLTKRSTMNFDAISVNPIFETVTSTNNVFQPVDSTFGLPLALRPASNDKRVQFYTTLSPAIAPRFRVNGFGATSASPWPYYLPDEMKLIKAECLLRQATPNLIAAKAEIDAVLQQTPAQDPLGVGADIATGYVGVVDVPSLLNEVYRNRCIELFMSGLRLEDMRRFGRPLTERKRNLFPYPFRERDNNPNTPADPAF